MWIVAGVWEHVFRVRCEAETKEEVIIDEGSSRERTRKSLLERRGGLELG
jgi:hypothetical protein